MIGGLRRPRREFARALIMAEGITAVRRIQKFQAGGGADVAPSGQESNLSRSLRFKERLETEILENAQRLASEQMFDNELGIGLHNQMGPYRSEAIDPSRLSVLDVPKYNVGALYNPVGSRSSGHRERFGPILDDAGIDKFESDMVYAIGVPRATPLWLAHEFGHRGDMKWGYERPYRMSGARRAILTHLAPESQTYQEPETFNLFFDAWRARTPEQWRSAASVWTMTQKRFFQATGGKQGHDYSTHDEGEADLIRLLDLNRENLLALEVNALAKIPERLYANLEERGLPYTRATPEKVAELRSRDFRNLSNQADFRARMTGRAPSLRDTDPVERAYGGGVYG